ncbi:MAG: fatty acid desaturase [Nevskiaceae bacterium]|nr:MAG: fatty acid desaturase [Nevskiaceae bacterium]TBR73618.1 MAG: fatty acid desaturase [Nevskiaceae bacterium]
MEQDLADLNKQAVAAARDYMGAVAWPTAVFALLTVALYVVNAGLYAAGWMPLLPAVLICGALTFFSYTPLHEAVHDNINGRNEKLKWLNDLCGYIVAPLIWVSYSSHRTEHFTHHRFTNQGDKDPDFMLSSVRNGLHAFVVYSVKFLWVQNTFYVKGGAWAKASMRERATYVAEIVFAIGWRVAFFAWLPSWETGVFLLAGFFLGALFTVYWFAYRPHYPYDNPARYRNTSSLVMPWWMKPVEWFWLGQNIHSIHHLFPRVPFYRYHVLHRRIEPIMRAHGTPIVGIFSRKPIPAAPSRDMT